MTCIQFIIRRNEESHNEKTDFAGLSDYLSSLISKIDYQEIIPTDLPVSQSSFQKSLN